MQTGNSVDVPSADKEILKTLEEVKTNPLEYTFDESGEYQFKLLDKASNIAYKTIKVDYLEDGNIIASDISYDITKTTNKNVVATINPYLINNKGEKLNVTIVNNNSSKQRTFNENGEFKFQYKNTNDVEGSDIKEHTARVHWIDKVVPTAEVSYSTEEATDGPVTVSLVNESEEIFVTNNNLTREYTFTENGDFTFEFEDKAGNIGTTTAKVNWIANNGNSNGGSENNGNENNSNENNSNGSENNGSGNSNSGAGNGGSGSNGGNGGSSNNGTLGQSGSQNNNSFDINDAEKDYPPDGKDDSPNIYPNSPLPQTGDLNIETYILISIFSLMSIILLIKIKSINKK